MVVTLDECKQYMRVDGDDENTLITLFITIAEDLCASILRFPLSEFTEIPETVKQSILFAVANFYEQRENVDLKNLIEVMTRLLFAYRRESW